jgi:hypothetical protein
MSDEGKPPIRRTIEDGDKVIVRDENGVIVYEDTSHGRRVRREIRVRDGWSIEHQKARSPLGGAEHEN